MSLGEKVGPLAGYKISELENSKQRYRVKIEELRAENKRLREQIEVRDLEVDHLQIDLRDQIVKHAERVKGLRAEVRRLRRLTESLDSEVTDLKQKSAKKNNG